MLVSIHPLVPSLHIFSPCYSENPGMGAAVLLCNSPHGKGECGK